MTRLLIALALFLPSVLSAGPVVVHYDIDVVLTPKEKKVRAEVDIKVIAPQGGLQRLDLLLNEGLVVASVQSTAGKVRYTVHKNRVGFSLDSPKAVPLSIELIPALVAGESTTLSLVYEGKIGRGPWGLYSAGEGWVELSTFSAWFPYSPEQRKFTYDVKVSLDSSFTVVGGEPVGTGGGVWSLTRDWRTSDIVIASAHGLQGRAIKGSESGATL